MNNFTLTGIIGLLVLVVVFIYDYFILLRPKYKIIVGKKSNKKKHKKIEISEIQFMNIKHKFTIPNEKLKNVIVFIALINAFIIAFTSSIIILIPWHMIWQLLIGFVLLFGLIYALYEIFGRILESKFGRN